MRHLLIKSALCLLVLLCIALPANAQSVLHAELLGRPTDSSITVQMHFADSAEVYVKYGTVSGVYPSQTSPILFTGGSTAEILISGLKPDTRYFYRVCQRMPGAVLFEERTEHTFQTARTPGKSFTFTVQADPHLDASSDTALYRVCLQNQLDDKPDFMIDLGDFLMTDKLRNKSNVVPHDTIIYRCNLLRSYYENICHSVPLFIAIGNHEGECGWYNTGTTGNNIAVWNTQERKKYFPNPYPNKFYSGDTTQYPYTGVRQANYSFTWGDALFIVLDPYWNTNPKPDSLNGWRWTLGKAQYDWLKRTLENSNAPFKFVFSHQLIGGDPDGRGGVEFADKYEWGGQNLDGTNGWNANRPGWYKPIKELLREHRVTIFFHGHDHFYAKQDKDCMVYQETPQPSLPIFTGPSQAAGYGYLEGNILPNTGHLRVTAGPNGVQVDYVRAYKPSNETSSRHNKDISVTYYIGRVNCYDSTTASPVLWNSNYAEEIVYPNPFSEQATLEFTLVRGDQVSLELFDEQGRMIKTLLSHSEVPAGTFKVVWDGSTNTGGRVMQGIYYYKLQGLCSGTASGKIVVN